MKKNHCQATIRLSNYLLCVKTEQVQSQEKKKSWIDGSSKWLNWWVRNLGERYKWLGTSMRAQGYPMRMGTEHKDLWAVLTATREPPLWMRHSTNKWYRWSGQLVSTVCFISHSWAEAPILWPPDVKNWLIWKDPDAGKDWRQEEKGTTEDEMVGWHH